MTIFANYEHLAEEPIPPTVTTSTDGNTLVIHLEGDIDFATAPQLGAQLNKLTADTGDAQVDLSGVDFCDAAGVRMFAAAAATVTARGGQLHLRGAREHLIWLLTTLGADYLLAPE